MTPLLRNVCAKLVVLLSIIYIFQILLLYGIESLAIHGGMAFDKRDETVSQFHTEGSPRVFIFSSVGSAGLNLSIADVVIFFVSLPSSFN